MNKLFSFILGAMAGMGLLFVYSSFIMPESNMEVSFRAYRKIDDPTRMDLEIRLNNFEGESQDTFLDAHLQLDAREIGVPFTFADREGVYVPLPVQASSVVVKRPKIFLMRLKFPVVFKNLWP